MKIKNLSQLFMIVISLIILGCDNGLIEPETTSSISNQDFETFIEENGIEKSGNSYFYENDIYFTKNDIEKILSGNNNQDSRGAYYRWVFFDSPQIWEDSEKLNLTYTFTNDMSTNRFTNEEVKSAFREAAYIWMSAANIKFLESTSGRIKISKEYRPDKEKAAAWATLPYSDNQVVVLNSYNTMNYSYDNLRSIFIHELGHTLGLAHEHQRDDSPDTHEQGTHMNIKEFGEYDIDSIMDYASSYNNRLSDGDVALIQYLYGEPEVGPEPEPATEILRHAPNADWNQAHWDTKMNYVSWDGSLWTAQIKDDYTFLHAPNGDFTKAHSSPIINYKTSSGSNVQAVVLADYSFRHAPNGDYSNAHDDAALNYLTWDGSSWWQVRINVGEFLNQFPNGHPNLGKLNTVINYKTWDGTEWAASIQPDKTFLHVPNGDFGDAHTSAYINYIAAGGESWTALIQDDNTFMHFFNGDSAQNHSDSVLNYVAWNDYWWGVKIK